MMKPVGAVDARSAARARFARRSVASMRGCTSLALVLAALLASAPRAIAQDPAAPPADEGEVLTAPVELDGAFLLRVRGVSSLPAAERARLIRERLIEVAGDESVPADSVRVVDDPNITRIMAGDRPIMGLVDADASLEQVTRSILAATHRLRLQQAIADYRAARSP